MPLALRSALLITGTLVALTSCEAVGVTGPGLETREQLLSHRQLWESQGITSYRFGYRRTCYCGDVKTLEIDVANGAVAAARYADDGAPVHAIYQTTLPTIDDLFDIIEEALDQRADALRVTYHRTLGYPTEILLDYRFVVADDEFGYTVFNLVLLPQ
jgi:hypothetical protein